MTQILPNLFLGNIHDAININFLVKNKIKAIVNASDYHNKYVHFSYMNIDVEDVEAADIQKYFTKVSRFICNCLIKGHAVLVHCNGGISRSPTLVIAFLIQKRRMSLTDAITFVRQKRPVILPNDGFLAQLRKRFET